MKLKSLFMLAVFLLCFNFRPIFAKSEDWSFSPTTTSPLISFQFTRFDGYGFELEVRKLSLGLFWIRHNSHDPGQLMEITNGVYSRLGTFLELNYRLLELSNFEFGLGINSLSIYPDDLGHQFFIQRTFEELAFIRLSYRTIKNIRALSINLGVDLFKVVEEFNYQFLSPD